MTNVYNDCSYITFLISVKGSLQVTAGGKKSCPFSLSLLPVSDCESFSASDSYSDSLTLPLSLPLSLRVSPSLCACLSLQSVPNISILLSLTIPVCFSPPQSVCPSFCISFSLSLSPSHSFHLTLLSPHREPRFVCRVIGLAEFYRD